MISTSIARIRRPASTAGAPHGFRRLAPPRALAALHCIFTPRFWAA